MEGMNKVFDGIWDSVFLIFTNRGNTLMIIIRCIDCKGRFVELHELTTCITLQSTL